MIKTFNLLLLLLMVGTTPAWSQWKPWNDLPPHCSHIIVIRGEEDRHLTKGVQFEETVQLLHPGPRALAATKEALLRMTPLLCRSVGRIAFGLVAERPKTTGAVNSFGAGDLVLINLAIISNRFDEEDLERRSSQLLLQETLIHETAHSAETLLATESKDGGPKGYGGAWGFAARNLARKTIEKVRLEVGLYNEWQRLHRSFREHGWALRYNNAADAQEADADPDKDRALPVRWRNVSHTQVAEAGFMNTYGASNWAEDMATFVGNTYIGPEMATGIKGSGVSENLRTDTACRELQEQRDRNVPAKLAAVYAKLMFLLDLGLVKEEDVAECTGARFGLLDVSGPGFHFFQKGKLLRRFENKVEHGMGSKGAGNIFEMRAEGQASFGDKTYPASLKLSLAVGLGPLEKASWPRGVYKLALVGPNKLSLVLEGQRAGNFDAWDAYVLVASSSGERISGSIFLTKAWRPDAPLSVPQVFDPPLHIRFELEK